MIKVAQGLLEEEELQEVKEAFEYGYFGHAYKVEEFEREIARLIGIDASNVATTNTGTSALRLALDAAQIGEGDEVLVPSLTFVATYQAISALRAIPVSCDVCEHTLLIDIKDAKEKITEKTKAIMPVHYCGHPCNMDGIIEMARTYNLRIIEDAAHAFGCDYNGKKIGSFGDISCFSFDSLKLISCGEGGAIVSKDTDLIKKVKLKRMLCMDREAHTNDWKDRSWTYDVADQGYRDHMSNINAAIGLAQIKKIDRFINRRREICTLYKNGLSNIDEIEFLNIDYDHITPFMFIIKVKNQKRDDLMDYLKSNEIESAIKYLPCHKFTYYKKNNEFLPVTERAIDQILELPLHCRLTDNDVIKVIIAVKKFFDEVSYK